jgi:predicted acylesterase/phospholipase RssA
MGLDAMGERSQWWLDPEMVHGFVQGVFEGGGTKGVLYIGALKGLLTRKLWFGSVAGSSAGAITAAMVAAGMHPDHMKEEMDRGLEAMALPPAWRGLRRVRQGHGYLDREKIRCWLRCLLLKQCTSAGLHSQSTGPTFQELFELTQIGLHVVAVDLGAGQLMVFNHILTPQCSVADAVMASATIPAAFEPLIFTSPLEEREVPRFVADGGIASNFPSFVFRDARFRTYSQLDSGPNGMPIVGFLLDEKKQAEERGKELLKSYKQGSFSTPIGDPSVPCPGGADEGPEETTRKKASSSRIIRRIARVVGWTLLGLEMLILKPMGWLAKGFQGNEPAAWSWPPPKNRHVGLWIEGFRYWLSAAPGPLIFGLVGYTAMFWLGFIAVARWLVPGFEGSSVVGYVLGSLFVGGILVFAVWVWLLGLGTFLALRIAYRTFGELGSPLIRTFMHTPAAPPWESFGGPDETVVRLEVPPGMTTLRIGSGVNREKALSSAEAAAADALAEITGAHFTPEPNKATDSTLFGDHEFRTPAPGQ